MGLEEWGAGAGGGLVIAILTALGLKSRMDRIEKNVRFKDTCNAMYQPLRDDIKEIKTDIKTLLSRRRDDRERDDVRGKHG